MTAGPPASFSVILENYHKTLAEYQEQVHGFGLVSIGYP